MLLNFTFKNYKSYANTCSFCLLPINCKCIDVRNRSLSKSSILNIFCSYRKLPIFIDNTCIDKNYFQDTGHFKVISDSLES